jgi:hypothetical protein
VVRAREIEMLMVRRWRRIATPINVFIRRFVDYAPARVVVVVAKSGTCGTTTTALAALDDV